jgi:hypothetical protein
MNFRLEFWEFAGGIALWIATGVIGPFLLAKIPAVRTWFANRPWAVSCIVAFFISGAMAAIVGNIVSIDLAKMAKTAADDVADLKESKFSIIVGGQISADGLHTKEFGLHGFTVVHKGKDGKYWVTFDKRLSRMPFIMVGAARDVSDTSTTKPEAAVLAANQNAFSVQTFQDKQPADADFWFVAIHPTVDPSVDHNPPR